MNDSHYRIGQKITVLIRGRNMSAVIIAVHPLGAIDVKASAGYFRVSGLGRGYL
jgi:Flp pilus assembly protein TadB